MLAAEIPGATKRRGDLDAAAAIRLSEWLRGYRPIQGRPDELFDPTGRPREYWLNFLGDLAEYTPDELKSRFSLATRHIRDTGVSHRVYGEENERSWPLSPVPLIIGHREWAQIVDGRPVDGSRCPRLREAPFVFLLRSGKGNRDRPF